MFTTKIEYKPLSVNDAWKGKRYKTDLYKKYEKDLLLILPKTKVKFDGMLRIELFFGFSSNASDLDNPVKPLLDIMQKKYGFNDNQIFELNIRKCIVSKGKEFITISVNNLLPI
jgi:Holliday junction resolvase RusA-like endonuclease